MKRILVVDDSVTVRLYIRSILEELRGFEIVDAENGVDALEKAVFQRFDLFIIDVNMPKLDGYGLLTEIREHPGLRAIPAIVATTEDKPEDRDRSYAAGANLHIPKPIVRSDLKEAVVLMTGAYP